ncbi:MAG: hypothetical protein IT379_20435 [Deltaproteobacteria bacterium]|nr:hypothetical protein [Deltaproteobacteria bacterium]
MVGRTRCCRSCRLRFAVGDVCPACGSDRALTAASELTLSHGRRWWAWPPYVGIITLGVLVAIAVTGGLEWAIFVLIDWLHSFDSAWTLIPQIPLWFLIIAVLIFGLGLPMAFGIVWAQALDAKLPGKHVLSCPSPPTFGPDAPRVRGVARCEKPLTAPLSGLECVAFELRTVGPTGKQRDSVATQFSLETEDGTVLEIDPCAGTWLDLPRGRDTTVLPREGGGPGSPAAAPSSPASPDRLRELCRTLALGLELGSLRVEQRVLRVGARVEVVGGSESTVPGGDYRGTARRVLLSSPSSPLLVRSLED